MVVAPWLRNLIDTSGGDVAVGPVVGGVALVVGLVAGIWQLAEYLGRLRFLTKIIVVIDREDADRGGGLLGLPVFRWNHHEAKFYVARINDVVFENRNGESKSLTAIDFSTYSEDQYDALRYLKDHVGNQNNFKVINNGRNDKWTLDWNSQSVGIIYYVFHDNYFGTAVPLEARGGMRYTYRFRQTDNDNCHLSLSDQRAIVDGDF